MPADRTNDEWLAALASDGPALSAALRDLRPVLLRALHVTLAPRVDRGAEALAQDIVQDALLQVRERAGQFRGDARFTTWAQKVAVHLALSELRRKRWEDVPLDALVAAPPSTPEPGADVALANAEAVDLVRHLVATELTDRQRTALEAILAGMPMDEVARRLDTNRNALYKLLHDGRLRLRHAFEARGLTPDDLLDG
ncbi:RNA polymerase sigma factor [Rubrivirga sp. IMCC45206]|uniref:RNA polymerase sigma factor n=1 Tax=Rubrivirga sp. IMCC45206 TaxID=3391614 RepID=UPI00398FF529